ncbi:acyltransferase-domain-containing protein [Artomyces pyxidatus]|uniref:Acyltransferase-domain-containing protein n=1 Tax=Artomyces pyxidatus TaxID=48021 RepID=A0ACB8T2H3_9AGAM|nr:acyltransferase-domain-containing protein [Artomyces pyxidatus]
MPQGTPTPWSYFLIRLLFKFVLKIFYGTIVVEGIENIPQTGLPCVVCANHTNSLTDALLLVTAIPSRKRNMLRLTAKSTQFGKKTLTSWLIESAGTVPIKRRKDFAEGSADNTDVMAKLIEALEQGDAVCLFPEGASRYHPTIAPLKTGVARIVSDTLSRNRDNPDFEISILTCSVTYMHRQHFRSDVLVTFNPPFRFRPRDNPELLAPVNYDHIRLVTAQMHRQIANGTFDAPTWDLIRTARTATPLYAPLGTTMSLGDYVRVTRTFLEAFKAERIPSDASSETDSDPAETTEIVRLKTDLRVCALSFVSIRTLYSSMTRQAYQATLFRLKIRDDRIRRPLPRPIILYRIFLRLSWAAFLSSISLAGLVLWTPVALTTFYAVHNFKKTGPVWDTWDEIAQYKLVYGLVSGVCVWLGMITLTLPFAPITAVAVPILMWMSLRWFEDAVSAFRAFLALVRLLLVPPATLAQLRAAREDLHARVLDLAVHGLGLPEDPETYFVENGEKQKGRVTGRWMGRAKYFSVRRRRKRDWNETLRLYEQFDYPSDDVQT